MGLERQSADLTALADLPSLPAASSFMSSRWSEDNLVTCHPRKLYTGRVRAQIDPAALGELLRQVEATTGPLVAGSVNMGVCTWDVACESSSGPVIVQFPAGLDEPGERRRSISEVPRQNVANARHFIQQNLSRFVLTPVHSLTLESGVAASVFTALPDHRPLTFGRGRLQVALEDGEAAWSLSLGPRRTADLLTEMVAALAYHYEPEAGGGTALTDVLVNDGDFVVKRHADGSFSLRLTAVRRRDSRIDPSLFLLYLIQLTAFEDWEFDGKLSGLPALISNPSIAFAGVVRGLRYRFRDRGRSEAAGAGLGRQWIEAFARTREGHAYRPWVDRFLAGDLAPTFGEDLRERWWRLMPLRQRQSVRELSARQSGDPEEVQSAAALKALLDGLTAEIGRGPERSPEGMRLNELDREQLSALLERVGHVDAGREDLAAKLCANWPYRSLEHLCALVPEASDLRQLPLDFGHLVSNVDEGTLRSLQPPDATLENARAVANPEMFGSIFVPPALHVQALRAFASFEAFMDKALHDETWGYYATSVVIGKEGHFSTHPESLSPHYGQWVAEAAFECWRDMCAHGELSEDQTFPVIEFGAGNGRLARDFLDAVKKSPSVYSSGKALEQWQTFAKRLEYRIYELSASLREKQRELLGQEAVVATGDARRPAATLKPDFPEGVRGFVVTNEVPDAFGVHKVLLTREGEPFVALVVPRIEASLRESLPEELGRAISDADARLRRTFAWQAHPTDTYLDAETYGLLMSVIAKHPGRKREALLCKLWFEEAYLPVACVPELAAHLAENAEQYATALAAEDSGVVLYVNVHAARFIEELALSLAAGSIVTIDYGYTTFQLIDGVRRGEFPFRIYCDSEPFLPRPNDPYTAPGMQDMTSDVNFTELAQAARKAGLSVIHFGHERDLAGGDLPELLRGSSRDAIAAFLGANVFKLLVLGTRPNHVFEGPLSTPLSLFHDASELPEARRARIPAIRAKLAGTSA